MERPALDRRDSKTASRSASDDVAPTLAYPARLSRSVTDPSEVAVEGNDGDGKAGRGRRLPHKLVERRYRLNLNGQIEALRVAIPSLKDYQSSGDLDDTTVSAKMLSKGAIISTAAQYIKELENDRTRLRENIAILMQQVESLRKLTRCEDYPILDYLTDTQLGSAPNQARGNRGPRQMEGRFVPGPGNV